ncbi:MAG: radical SAM protein [Candidatus Methanomethylicia archaeon]
MSRAKAYSKILDSYLKFKIGRLKPLFTSYSITYRCNLKCSYCSNWRIKSSELNTVQALKVVDKLGDFGVAIVDFSGGEPTLRRDLEILARRLHEYSCTTSMNTNGTLINNHRTKRIAKVFDYVTVSIDGLPEVNDMIRGAYGVYVKSINTVRNLRREGVRVGVNTVISKSNIDTLSEFIDNIIDDVDYLTLQPIHSSNIEDLRINDDKILSLVNYIVKVKKTYPGKIPLTYSYIYGFINYFKGRMRKICDASKLYFAVDPNGNVLACGARGDIVLGNILTSDLNNILLDGYFKVLNTINSCRGCWLACTTGLSLTMRESISGNINLIKHIIPSHAT